MNIDAKTILPYLERLRWRIVRAIIALLLASVAGYYLAPVALRTLLAQSDRLGQLVFLSPGEALFSRFRLAVTIGALISLPIILHQLLGAFAPALSPADRRMLWLTLPAVYLLFVGGVAFAYLAIMPLALRFFLSFAGDQLEPVISVANFLGFAIGFMIPFGLVFELPVVLVLLSRLGLVTPLRLVQYRKYAILVIFIVAALLTPADVFSQLAMAIPMVALYEVSILLARMLSRQREK